MRRNEVKRNNEGIGVTVRESKVEVISASSIYVSSIYRRVPADSRTDRVERAMSGGGARPYIYDLQLVCWVASGSK